MEQSKNLKISTLQRIQELYRLGDYQYLEAAEAIDKKSTSVPERKSFSPEKIDRYGNYRNDMGLVNVGFYKVTKDLSLDKESSTFRLGKKLIGRDDLSKYIKESIFSPLTEELEKDRKLLSERELSRIEKWKQMCTIHFESGNQLHSFRITRKLIQRTFKGIPDCWRSIAWWSFLMDDVPDSNLINHYYDLCDQICEYDVQIDLDVPRTAATHFLFRKRYNGGQRLLFRVLHSIALYLPHVGYVQGMASIAATLLIYYTEELAFIMMVNLLERRGMSSLFSSGFEVLLKAFDDLKEELQYLPSGRHLSNIGAEPSAFATRWYLTIFHQCVPFHTQLRIWDLLFLLGGNEGQTIRLLQASSLALVRGMWDTLMDADFEVVMQALSGVIPIRNDDAYLARIEHFWQKMPSEAASKN
ncbi:GTPase activating protein [Schizosaccharomyces cryophilus OY26]|uniref:GTPase activating protein n=1 Tax=Schizosaccharomyces cryophilus (strain OY26 / ATCC MYA-4695 / CBS 11777 / NBRC 106824 / NRRL Y48691) TaxID=653667 RepID=S9W1S6_SCHCR|nr:GTPase activating protein [Schizosaccharomyces cryophilus OY26]EPY53998.1 GTPase activating protein [Schizosaccharomyces cryophilus OY26]